MCGFIGFSKFDKKLLNKLSLTIKDRAIDNESYFYNKNLSLYHAHLKISDLNKYTNQPYFDDKIIVSLVGEIYNKDYLIKLIDCNFKGDNFTELEVIGLCFNKFGEKFINYLNGEFAIFIYDKIKNEYFLFRDRYGVNLIYYRLDKGILYFGSEIKSLLIKKPELSKNGFFDYMIFQYTISPNTIINDILSLEPGKYLKFSGGKLDKIDFDSYLCQTLNDNLIYTLIDSIKRRLPNDQDKIFLSLSGGPDSNLLLHTLYNNYNGEIIAFSLLTFDNSREIEIAKKNTSKLGIKHLILDIDELAKKYDLFNDFIIHEGLVQLLNIFKLIKLEYPQYNDIKVSFSGDGKEELLLMNSHYPYSEIISRYKFFNKKYNIFYNINHEFLNLTLFDFNLQLYDKVSLKNGVEVRLPFTDYELLKYKNYRNYRYEVTKYLLKYNIEIIREEYGYGLGLKFEYFYDKKLIENKKKLINDFKKIYLNLKLDD